MATTYSKVLLSWYKSTAHRGIVSEADYQETGYNPKCGDRLTFYVGGDQSTGVKSIRYVPEACMLCTASAEAAVKFCLSDEKLVSQLIREVEAIAGEKFKSGIAVEFEQPLYETLKAYPARETCLTLPWNTMASLLKKLK